MREGFQLATAKRKKFQRRFQGETSATPEISANSFIGFPPGCGFRDGSYFGGGAISSTKEILKVAFARNVVKTCANTRMNVDIVATVALRAQE